MTLNLIQGPSRTGAGEYPESWDEWAYNRTGDTVLAGALLMFDFPASRAAETTTFLPGGSGTSPFENLVYAKAVHLSFGQFAIVLGDNSPAQLANDGLVHIRRFGVVSAIVLGTTAAATFSSALVAQAATDAATAVLQSDAPPVGAANTTNRKVLAYPLTLPVGDGDPAETLSVWFNGIFGWGSIIDNATA